MRCTCCLFYYLISFQVFSQHNGLALLFLEYTLSILHKEPVAINDLENGEIASESSADDCVLQATMFALNAFMRLAIICWDSWYWLKLFHFHLLILCKNIQTLQRWWEGWKTSSWAKLPFCSFWPYIEAGKSSWSCRAGPKWTSTVTIKSFITFAV